MPWKMQWTNLTSKKNWWSFSVSGHSFPFNKKADAPVFLYKYPDNEILRGV